jgi:hypothetical protein
MPLTFSDGVSLPVEGELRLYHGPDGWYVLGKGMSCPVDSKEEGEELLSQLQGTGDGK